MLASPFPSSVSTGEQDMEPHRVCIPLPTGCSPVPCAKHRESLGSTVAPRHPPPTTPSCSPRPPKPHGWLWKLRIKTPLAWHLPTVQPRPPGPLPQPKRRGQAGAAASLWHFDAPARARWGQLGRATIPSALWAKPTF